MYILQFAFICSLYVLIYSVLSTACVPMYMDQSMYMLAYTVFTHYISGMFQPFILSALMKGQANTIGIAMRRALLGEIEGEIKIYGKVRNYTNGILSAITKKLGRGNNMDKPSPSIIKKRFV